MNILTCKDIFFNIQNFLDNKDIISLSKTNKKFYLFIFEFNFRKEIEIVFNLKIISRYSDKQTIKDFSDKIISIKSQSKKINYFQHIYLNKIRDIEKISIHSHIQTLIIGHNCEICSQYSFLPDKLKKLIFRTNFNNLLGNNFTTFIPHSVEKIIFGDIFNQILGIHNLYGITKYIPNNVKFLKFGKKFNSPIYIHDRFHVHSLLPNDVETLIFGENFNQKIHKEYFNLIPNTVKYLTFGPRFNQKICDKYMYYIPYSVIELTIHNRYQLDDIPLKVKTINFINSENKLIRTIRR